MHEFGYLNAQPQPTEMTVPKLRLGLLSSLCTFLNDICADQLG